MNEQVVNERLKREFWEIAEQLNLAVKPSQKLIIDFFFGVDNHFSVKAFIELREKTGTGFTEEDVVAALELLVKYGFARKSCFEDKEALYEHHHLTEHHDHMLCLMCGGIFEFFNPEIEKLQNSISAEIGLHPLHHKMEIYGLCRNCMVSREVLIPLTMSNPMEKLVLKEIRGGKELAARLADMGLTPGVELEIISSFGGGPLIVSVRDSRVAIGSGMAMNVIVSPVGKADQKHAVKS